MSAEADRRLVGEIRSAYEGSAEGWATGPAAVYRRLAAALVATTPASLRAQRVLDLGAGTGVASEALLAAGARPVAVDLAWAMLCHRRARRPPGVVGDAQALPFAAGAFDGVVAAFSLNHVPDPAAALAQCRRVTRVGGAVLASSFPLEGEHPAKAVVEAALTRHGYRRPAWYEEFKARVAERTGDRRSLEQAAAAAGLDDAAVDLVEVDAGLDDPELAADWRLHMPHTLAFLAELDERRRAAVRAEAVAALPPDMPASIAMLALRARVT